jgi:homocysteine S-methyltransferase
MTTSTIPTAGGPSFVTDGGMETDLIFNHGVDLPEFAAFPLLDDAVGRQLLASYYDGYAAIALAHAAHPSRRSGSRPG